MISGSSGVTYSSHEATNANAVRQPSRLRETENGNSENGECGSGASENQRSFNFSELHDIELSERSSTITETSSVSNVMPDSGSNGIGQQDGTGNSDPSNNTVAGNTSTRNVTNEPSVAVRVNTFRNLSSEVDREFRKEFTIFTITAVPIFIATVILLAFDFTGYADFDKRTCAGADKLRVWCIINAIRIAVVTTVFGYMIYKNVDVSPFSGWHKIRGFLSSISLLWILIGLYFVISFRECSLDVYYSFTLAFVLAECGMSLLPFLLFLLLLPFICLCLPCFLRILVKFSNKSNSAVSKEIAKIKLVTYGDKSFEALDSQMNEARCSICLTDYEKGDQLRVLPCGGSHYFHKECVDDWLMLNNSCPYCRGKCLSLDDGTNNV